MRNPCVDITPASELALVQTPSENTFAEQLNGKVWAVHMDMVTDCEEVKVPDMRQSCLYAVRA